MANSNEIFGQRLKSAREMQGLSLADLAEKLSGIVTRQAISKYETGKMLPDSTVLISLARALGVKPDYFFRPFHVVLSGIEFRKKASMSAKSRKAIQQLVLDSIERYLEIEELCGLSHYAILPYGQHLIHTEKDVTNLASKIRQEWGLGEDGIIDVISLLESKGIKVIEIESAEPFDGLSGTAEGSLIIILNASLSTVRKRFTTLHELGHLVMRFEDDIDDKQKEMFCNLFASEFLIPQSSFKNIVGEIGRNPINLRTFADIQHTFGISIDALFSKALDLHIINKSRYYHYYVCKNTIPRFKEYIEKVRSEDEHPERFEALVYDALSKDIISISKAASLLNTSVDNVMSNAITI